MNKWCTIVILLCQIVMFPHYSTTFKIIVAVLCFGMVVSLILSIIEDKKKEPDKIIDMRNHN